MAKELNEDTSFKVSLKTLGGIAVLIFTLVGMWFTWVKINTAIPPNVFKLTLKLVSSFNSFAIF
jgi:hypothetical protein